MERVDKVMKHPAFRENMEKIEKAEIDRFFCRHGLNHALDVARIFYILVLEEGISVDKELVYATALLHDIGRYEQYENGTPHNEAGAKLAGEIMASCGFSEDECAMAVNAIKGHRRDSDDSDMFGHLLYKADKLSRDCYQCEAEPECYWSAEQKNMRVKY